LMARLERLEQAATNGNPATPKEAAPPRTPQAPPDAAASGESPEVEDVEPEEDPVESGSPEPEMLEPEGTGREEDGVSRGSDVELAGQWADIMGELKRRKQALTAAVYGEARVEGFAGGVLTLVFPEDQDFYVGMAKDRKHADALGEVLEERVGSRPRLQVRTGEEDPVTVSTGQQAPPESSAPAAPPEPPPRDVVPESPVREEEPPGVWEDEAPGRTVAGANGSGAASGPSEFGDDGTIRSEAEVFEIMRDFGPFGQNKET
ncbi:MAG: hypothetical protein M3522_13755, partial [Actinomycetota bacterium]|nr:hypothetical protein [Actinomycetota bacterium]